MVGGRLPCPSKFDEIEVLRCKFATELSARTFEVSDNDFLGSANIFMPATTGESGTDFDVCTPAHLYSVRMSSIENIAADDGNVEWRKFSVSDLVSTPNLHPYIRFGALLALDHVYKTGLHSVCCPDMFMPLQKRELK